MVDLWKHYKELAAAEKGGTKPVDPLAAMEAVIVECKIPTKLAYAFRSNHAYFGRMFLRDWQALGPFGDSPRPPRVQGV